LRVLHCFALILLGGEAVLNPSLAFDKTTMHDQLSKDLPLTINFFQENKKQKDKQDSLILTGIQGILGLRSGLLKNIRFCGNYGSYNPKFLPHYLILKATKNRSSRRNIDWPQDYTTALIQHLFPSDNGIELSSSEESHDFFNLLSTKQLKAFLDIFYHARLSYKKVPLEKSYPEITQCFQKIFAQFFSQCLEKLEGEEQEALYEQWQEENYFKTLNLPEEYANMFAGVLREEGSYPPYIIETALQAFIWKKENEGDYALSEEEEELEQKKSTLPLAKDDYFKWKKGFNNGKPTLEMMNALLEDPYRLVHYTLAYDAYESPFPEILDTGKASVAHEEGLFGFSDCGEVSLRDFLNVLLGDSLTRTFIAEYLTGFNNISSKLFDFYLQEQKSYAVVGRKEMRSRFAEIVSSLAGVDYRLHKGNVACEISSRYGVQNMLMVLEKLLGLQTEWDQLKQQDLTPEQIYTTLFNDLFQRFNAVFEKANRKDFYVDWHVAGGTKEIPAKYFDMVITINGIDQFLWTFIPGHFAFEPIKTQKTTQDWRKAPEITRYILTHMTENETQETLLGILPFYLDEFFIQKLLHFGDDQIHNEKLAPFVLYGFPFSQGNLGREKMQRLDWVLKLNPTIARTVAHRWMETLPEEDELKLNAISLVLKYPDFFEKTYFNKKEFPRLKQFYAQLRLHLKNTDQPGKIIFPLFKHPLNETLIIHLISLIEDSSQVINLKSLNSGKNLLHWAAESGFVRLTKTLIDNPEILEGLLSSQNLKDREGFTPLHLAAIHGNLQVIEALLDNPEVAQVLLAEQNWHSLDGDSPLDLIEFRKSLLQEQTTSSLEQKKDLIKIESLLLSKLH
jgi:hypothetical protein